MEVTTKRHIQNGEEYNELFPKSKLEVTVIKRNAKLEDTIDFLPQAINKTLYQTKNIAKQFEGNDTYENCRAIWQFVYDHIKYRKDEDGKEQIQSPQYTWSVKAGDCDDYTVMIASILRNLNFKVCLRIAMYKTENGYQHIYPLVILADNSTIIMDCVAEKFDYEVPYIKKIDKIMELQFLNGIPKARIANSGIDADDLLQGEDMGELGKKGKIKAKIKERSQNVKTKVKAGYQKVKNSKVLKTIKKTVHAVNKVNPATALLRAGILIAMKTNVLHIAENLRFAYFTPEQAQQKNLDMGRWQRLVGVKNRLAKIFHGAGGEDANLKKAILTGKGNRSKEVPLSGLGAIDGNDYNDSHSLQQILGIETYNSEIGQVEGLGTLGIVAATAVASSMSVLTAIVAAIKSIGSLRKKKSEKTDGQNEDKQNSGNDNSGDNGKSSETNTSDSTNNNDNSDNASDSKTRHKDGAEGGANESSDTEIPALTNDTDKGERKSTNSTGSGSKTSSNGTTSTDSEKTSGNGDENEKPATDAKGVTTTDPKTLTAFAKLTNWVKENPLPAAGIGIVVISGIAYGLHLIFKPKAKSNALSGLPKKKHYKLPYTSTKIKIHRLK